MRTATRTVVNSVTQFPLRAGILAAMIFLAAFNRLTTPAEPPANDLLAGARAAIGHISLAIIALVIVLLNFWKI